MSNLSFYSRSANQPLSSSFLKCLGLLIILLIVLSGCAGSGEIFTEPPAPEAAEEDALSNGNDPVDEPASSSELLLGFTEYRVSDDDSLFTISDKFGVSPESILFCNEDVLNDNPHMLRAGTDLLIPPLNGALYEWEEGDNLVVIAGRHHVDPDLIVSWVGNNLDYEEYLESGNAEITIGQSIFIPMGTRPFEGFIIPSVDG